MHNRNCIYEKIIISFHCFWKSQCIPLTMHQGRPGKKLVIKRWKSPQKTLENLCPLPGAVGFMSVVNGPHNVHLYHIKLQKHYYNYKISSISCHAAARSEHPNYLSKTCFLFLTFYWLIMDRSILQCTIPSIQHFPAITNETRENIIMLEPSAYRLYLKGPLRETGRLTRTLRMSNDNCIANALCPPI